ncbi:PDR/VanB family oxidoreductase [Rhodococcus erythropolis]|uniref:PDR/VanB family oxidoreductase n=1 Tax=Rhodococcus erythropolis TaxID=1833 RepID=UPI00211DA8A0|nr:PDR/VanB family oxidoreductase [Rhodococcus erythropolis]
MIGLELVAGDGRELPAWEPGAHIDLVLPDGSIRQYSLCGDPQNRFAWRLGILRETEGRGGSRWIHDQLGEGDVIETRGPRNHFPLETASRYLFIGGGIGITPILPMVRAAQAQGAQFQVVYGGRSRDTMGFVDELARLGKTVEFYPESECGLIDLDRVLGSPSDETLIYCCGPEALLSAVEDKAAGWPNGSLRIERFGARSDRAFDPAADQPFEVELAPSGEVLKVPGDRTLLSVLEEAGADVLSSCAEGTCGSCETTVVSGEVEHRDSVLTEAEQATNDRMMICVSRSRGPRLVLDVAVKRAHDGG